METLDPQPSVESLRARVAAFERERARLCRELDGNAGARRLRVVDVAVAVVLLVCFAFGVCAGEGFEFPPLGERPYDPNRPLPLVKASN
jgi:hypothetical protein